MTRTQLSLAALSLSILCAAVTAEATPMVCAAGSSQGDHLALSDVTFRGSGADDCFGVQSGNDRGARGAFIGWNGFEQLLSDNSGDTVGSSRSWMGIDWILAGAANARSGAWSLSWSDPSSPLKRALALDLVVILKASERFAAYRFNGESFASASSSGSGAWQVSFRNAGNQIPKLSHLSIWARIAPVAVTEPGTLGLLALGLIATAAVAARGRREPATA